MTFQKENMLILQIKDLGLAVQAMAASPLPGLETFQKNVDLQITDLAEGLVRMIFPPLKPKSGLESTP